MYSKYQVLHLNFQAKLQPDFLVCLLHFTEVTLRFLSDVFQNVHQLLGKLLATIFRCHSNGCDMAVPILPLAFHLSQDCQQCIHQPQICTSTTLSSTELGFNVCVSIMLWEMLSELSYSLHLHSIVNCTSYILTSIYLHSSSSTWLIWAWISNEVLLLLEKGLNIL